MQKLLKRFEGFLKYGIASILFLVPLYPKFPFIKIPGTYVSIRIEDFVILVLSIIFFVFFFKDIKGFLKSKLEFSVLIFILAGFVSVLSGILLTKTATPLLGVLHWVRRIEYFVPLGMGILYFKRFGTKDLEFFLKVLVVVVAITFIYGYGQKNFSWPVIITQNDEYSKGIALRWVPGSQINSTFAGHYDLSSFLVLVLPILVCLFFSLKGFWTKLTLGGVFLSGLWLLSAAASRISIVAFLLAVGISLLLLKKYKEIVLVFAVSLIFFSLSGVVISRYGRIFEVIFQKVKSVVMIPVSYAQSLPPRRESVNSSPTPMPIFEDRSTSIRLNVEWPRAIRAFSKNPLLGTGYSSITLATDNDFLRLLGEAGLLGLLSFLVIFINIGLLLKKAIKKLDFFDNVEKVFIASYVGALVGVIINSCFIDIFESSKFIIIFWLITGLTISMVRNRLNVQNN